MAKFKGNDEGAHHRSFSRSNRPWTDPYGIQCSHGIGKQVGKQIFHGKSATLPGGSELTITEFSADRLGFIPNKSNPKEIRVALDEVTETRNRETMVIGTKAGGATCACSAKRSGRHAHESNF